jgi:WD40 repeat protein
MKNFLFTLLINLILFLSGFGQANKKTIELKEKIGDFTGIVYDLCFSHSGKTLVIPESNQVCFYDINSKALTRRFSDGHSNRILTIDMSADSTLLVSGGLDSVIVIHNPQSGEIVKRLKYHHGVITSLSLNSDKLLLASGSSDRTVVVYDLSSGNIAYKLEDFVSDITVVKFSPNGRLMAVASLDKIIKLYDSKSGQLIANLDGHKKSVRDLCFNKDGTRLFSCGDDSRLIKWDIRNINQIKKENIEGLSSDWLLSVDVNGEACVVSGLDSKINVITNFGTYLGKIGIPVNKLLFVPNLGSVLKLVVATRGKGVFMLDTQQFDSKL